MKKYILLSLLAVLVLTSCGEYQKIQKSTDANAKFEAVDRKSGEKGKSGAACVDVGRLSIR